MKKELNPALIGLVLAVVIVIAGFIFWKGSQPAKNPPGGMFGSAEENIPKGK